MNDASFDGTRVYCPGRLDEIRGEIKRRLRNVEERKELFSWPQAGIATADADETAKAEKNRVGDITS
jgi:hypothetical protein